ncbi:P-loop containing nucleoside triphosphate hydrolase protein [Leptodontidium sp. 2 PMI_412]|nr:P-loop containing nucleoside triphosphate hydrolase protein [Leptodontidium sp. 2 PMI_412]
MPAYILFSQSDTRLEWADTLVLLQWSRAIYRAPESFFTATDLGSILNRFAPDMSLIEGPLSIGLLATTTNLFSTLAEAALIATGSPFVVIALPPLFSPLYTYFLEILEGISTIRAFGWEREFRDLFTEQVDDSQKPYYLMFCIQNWLPLVLDLISGGMAVTVVILAINLRHWTSAGLLGVAMNNLLSFNLSLSAVLSGWTTLETSLGAIARSKDFEAETEVEDKLYEVIKPTKDWPTQGLLEIESISAEYNKYLWSYWQWEKHPPIYDPPDLTHRTIKIDSLDIPQLQRTSIRQQITSIPQDALYVPGTLRFNTDPFGLSTDSQIVSALTKVDLWQVLSERGGLDTELLPDGLSKGQFQLLALARALLQKRKLVLMDEATSSIDVETARKITDMVETEFQGSTILTVAHRKETILGAGVVVVMEQGEVVEMGDPRVLMGKEGSRLSALLQDEGSKDL